MNYWDLRQSGSQLLRKYNKVKVHEALFQREFLQISVERHQVKRIVYDPVNEEIVQWIS